MKTLLLAFFITIISVLSGCSGQSTHRILTDIESFIWERPDSALAVLDTMDRTSLKTERQRAHHALLHAMALDKNYINVSEDSIAQVAVDYYSKHGSRQHYARSLYYLGLAYYYQEENTRAIIEFTKAEKVAVTCDSLYLGFTKVAQADTYARTHNDIEEEKYLTEALEIFSSLSEKYYTHAVLLRLAQVYSNIGSYDESENILKDLITDVDIAENIKSSALVSLAHTNIVKEIPDLLYAETLFRRNHYEYAGKNMTIRRYWAWAYSLHAIGRKKEAKELIEQLGSDDKDVSSYWLYMIAKSDGDTQSSLNHLEKCIKYNDREISDIVKQSVAISQRNYYESIAENLEYKTRNARLTTLVIILASVFSLILVYILIMSYVKKQEYIKEKNLLYISEIKRQLEESKREDYPQLKKKYLALYRSRFETIGALYEQLRYSKDLRNSEELLYKKVDALVINFTMDYNDTTRFEAMLDEDLDNIMSNLRREVPDLKKMDYAIFSLFVIGFDATTISHLLNTSMNAIYIRKSRIKRHIEDMNPRHKEQFLEVLD